MPTLTSTRARVETDLDDATLQTIIDAETEFLTRHVGATGSEIETHRAFGLREIVLKRKPESITSIKERRHYTSEEVTLAVDDWRRVGNFNVLRVADGTNPAGFWGQETIVEYVPDTDSQLRERVLLDLIQLSVEFRAMDNEEAGDWAREEASDSYARKRRALVRQVTEGRALF